MNYQLCSVSDVITQIREQKILLPAIQRKFVWDHEQIECFLDSIMRGYPIGTFLFWKIKGRDEINKYTFYKFIQEYHEKDFYNNEVAAHPIDADELTGVLDGQQRLSSLYIALQGSYAYKEPYKRGNNQKAFPKRTLFLNLFSLKNYEKDNEIMYEFKFLEEKKTFLQSADKYWYPVKNILKWQAAEDLEDIYESLLAKIEDKMLKEIFTKETKNIKKTLRLLFEKIRKEPIINYFPIDDNNLDEILDIFIRVNDGGTKLSKTNLLLSTIIANWDPAKSEIEELIKTLNTKGQGFRFNEDVIMKSCLCLLDKQVVFKVSNFTKELVKDLEKNWEKIKTAIENTVDVLVELGFNAESITANNAIVPIIYYIYIGLPINSEVKKDIKKYLTLALVKQMFGRAADTVLLDFRNIIKEEKSIKKLMISDKLKQTEKFDIDEEFLEELLTKKKSPYTFLLLTLLYPGNNYSKYVFHQDHLHPDAAFKDKKLRDLCINSETIKEWQSKKDSLPNLQLLEGSANQSKKETPLEDWINIESENDIKKRNNILDKNMIPRDIDLKLINFSVFYQKRKEILKTKLSEMLTL